MGFDCAIAYRFTLFSCLYYNDREFVAFCNSITWSDYLHGVDLICFLLSISYFGLFDLLECPVMLMSLILVLGF